MTCSGSASNGTRSEPRKPSFFEINLSARYNFDLGGNKSLGIFFDVFNLTNRLNINNIQTNRSSGNFLQDTSALLPRQAQIGARFSF